jgi:hypothetical protein
MKEMKEMKEVGYGCVGALCAYSRKLHS